MTSYSSIHASFGASLPSPQQAWRAALGELQLQLTADIFEMYLHPTRYMAFEDGTFLVAVPNGFVKDWLDIRLNRVIKRTLEHLMNRAVEVKYVVQSPDSRASEQPASTPLLDSPPEAPSEAVANGRAELTSLVGEYTFETFVVGPNNRMAHAAAMSVAEKPGRRYNPLFLYSGVGLGKTHLMHAIGHRARQTGIRVVYVSSEVFTNELIAAIRTNSQEQFRAKYRTSDVLLLDDIQFLAGKSSTQEELFHTFNALHEAGRQVVLACDRPPKAIATLENRLQSRFAWGLIADIQPPDLEMRLAILQAKTVSQGVSLANDVMEAIARLVPSNVRELEGALTKVLAHLSLGATELTPQTVEAILADMMPPRSQVEPEALIDLVVHYYGLTLADLASNSRKKPLVQARQVAMYLLREDLDLSFAAIGQLLGDRDHATVIYGVRKVTDLLETDEALKREIAQLREQLLAPVPLRVRLRR